MHKIYVDKRLKVLEKDLREKKKLFKKIKILTTKAYRAYQTHCHPKNITM